MANKRAKPVEIVTTLRQVEVLVGNAAPARPDHGQPLFLCDRTR